MNKDSNSKLLYIVLYMLVFAIAFKPSGIVIGQEGPFGGIKEKMVGISETERKTLQNLFVLGQQIKEMEEEAVRITRNIEIINEEIEGLKVTIAGEEIAYTKKLEDLKQVLKSYQRMGPGTYLEIILSSDNLEMLLRRINTLRDLTRNTGKLMELLEDSKEKQYIKKTNLVEKITLMEDNQKQFRESLIKKKQLIEEQEKYLASLKEKKEYYQENLANLQHNWDELKAFVPEIIQELSMIIDEGNIPYEKLNIAYSFLNIKGSINEKTINEIMSVHPLLPKIVFSFHPNNVELSMPEQNLILSGIFVIQETHTIKFQVQEGSFYGMPLDVGSIEDLFIKGDLVFNLELPLGDYALNSIKTTDGYLEMTIIPK